MRDRLIIGALLASAATFAYAQTQSPTTPMTPPAGMNQQMDPSRPTTTPGQMNQGQTGQMNQGQTGQMNQGQTGQMNQGAMQYGDAQTADQWLASNLMNRRVYGSDGRNVGEINDAVIDRNGQIRFVVIGVGGFLGIGEKDVAVPFQQLEIQRVANANSEEASVRIVTRAARAELESAPRFREFDWRTAPGTTGSTTPGAGMGGTTGTTGTGTMGTGTTTPTR